MKYISLLLTLCLALIVNAQDFVQVGKDSIHYEIRGHGEPWIIFSHGCGGNLNNFNDIFDSLSTHTTVVRYSRSGNGQSSFIDKDKDFDFIVNQLHDFLDSINAPEKVILGAWSFGGLICRNYMTLYPSKIHGIVSIDPTFESYFETLLPFEPKAKEIEKQGFYLGDSALLSPGQMADFDAMYQVFTDTSRHESWFNYPSEIPHFLLSSQLIMEENPLRNSKEIMLARYNAQKEILLKSDYHLQISFNDAGHGIQHWKPNETIAIFILMINHIKTVVNSTYATPR